ncbi:ATP-binding cassette domain-containing protein [Salsuginibacillus kocurii]|uniref:ATP-binding cassette domain-containing protein n=1 Tax=Salsuginibacillus kocurii TaxID=427078 RepID=UPI000373C794|nr:ABC transporter ATP-binding protein [Salsuginibacillus kocurii]
MIETAISGTNLQVKRKHFKLAIEEITIPRGLFTLVLGRNGSGKTTLFEGLTGMTMVANGTWTIEDFSMPAEQKEANQFITYINHDLPVPYDFTLSEALHFQAAFYKRWNEDFVASLLRTFELDPHQKVGQFSKGQRQAAAFILGMGHEPRIVLLDEATDGIDAIYREQMLAVLQHYLEDETKTIIAATHHIAEMERVCDYFLYIEEGSLLFADEKETFLEHYVYFWAPPQSSLPAAAILQKEEKPHALQGVAVKAELPDDDLIKTEPVSLQTFFTAQSNRGNES